MLRAVDTIARTDTGRQRRGNEDASYAQPPLFVVADGMGGARAGEVASRIAVEMFERGLPPDGTPESRLTVVAQDANREIHALSLAERELDGMGTTLTAAYLDESYLAIAHVGDSRAYMFRAGELARLTEDHSLVDELVKAGKLTEEQALEHPQRSIITRALGPEAEVAVDTRNYPLRAGDVLLLCSDGLTSMLSDPQIAAILVAATSLQEAAERLIDAANEAGGRDNITVVLTRFEDEDDALDVEQPTMVGVSGPALGPARSGPLRAEPAPGGRASPRARRSAPAGRRARLARTQGLAQRRPPQRELGRFAKTVIAVLSASIVLFLFGGGGYLASRQLYFLGTNAQGMVAVYRGFPYVLPFGIRLYETFYVSGVPASLIPPDRRTTLLNHDLHSQTAATKLINDLELDQVSG
jgi:protein phosphatase